MRLSNASDSIVFTFTLHPGTMFVKLTGHFDFSNGSTNSKGSTNSNLIVIVYLFIPVFFVPMNLWGFYVSFRSQNPRICTDLTIYKQLMRCTE